MRDLMQSNEVRDLADDVRRVFDELERTGSCGAVAGECTVSLDVHETSTSYEITVELPGLASSSVRVLIKRGAVLVAGEKTPESCERGVTFQLVERSFGRFARAVRLASAVDGSQARALLRDGVLRLTVPKIEERRGRELVIPIVFQE